MKAKDKISKSAFTLLESAKDSASKNIMSAVQQGKVKVEASTLNTLLNIINASIDEGYHKGHKTFMKTVDVAIDEAEKSFAATVAAPTAKKK